jgi:hypothetical protein
MYPERELCAHGHVTALLSHILSLHNIKVNGSNDYIAMSSN